LGNGETGRQERDAFTGKRGEVVMPSYEYYCRKCERTFEVHMSIKEHASEQVRCPHCEGVEVEQRLAPFVAVTSKKS
jgi:putative FmdB family regulatory protein